MNTTGVHPRPPTGSSAVATASAVLGVLSWLGFSLLCSIPAVVTGHMAKAEIRRSEGAVQGGNLAMVGLVAGYANIVLSLLAILLASIALLGSLSL